MFSWFQVCLGPTTTQAGPTVTMLALQPPISFLLTSLLCVNQLQQCHAVYASGDKVFSGHVPQLHAVLSCSFSFRTTHNSDLYLLYVEKLLSTSCTTILKELSVTVGVNKQFDPINGKILFFLKNVHFHLTYSQLGTYHSSSMTLDRSLISVTTIGISGVNLAYITVYQVKHA